MLPKLTKSRDSSRSRLSTSRRLTTSCSPHSTARSRQLDDTSPASDFLKPRAQLYGIRQAQSPVNQRPGGYQRSRSILAEFREDQRFEALHNPNFHPTSASPTQEEHEALVRQRELLFSPHLAHVKAHSQQAVSPSQVLIQNKTPVEAGSHLYPADLEDAHARPEQRLPTLSPPYNPVSPIQDNYNEEERVRQVASVSYAGGGFRRSSSTSSEDRDYEEKYRKWAVEQGHQHSPVYLPDPQYINGGKGRLQSLSQGPIPTTEVYFEDGRQRSPVYSYLPPRYPHLREYTNSSQGHRHSLPIATQIVEDEEVYVMGRPSSDKVSEKRAKAKKNETKGRKKAGTAPVKAASTIPRKRSASRSDQRSSKARKENATASSAAVVKAEDDVKISPYHVITNAMGNDVITISEDDDDDDDVLGPFNSPPPRDSRARQRASPKIFLPKGLWNDASPSQQARSSSTAVDINEPPSAASKASSLQTRINVLAGEADKKRKADLEKRVLELEAELANVQQLHAAEIVKLRAELESTDDSRLENAQDDQRQANDKEIDIISLTQQRDLAHEELAVLRNQLELEQEQTNLQLDEARSQKQRLVTVERIMHFNADECTTHTRELKNLRAQSSKATDTILDLNKQLNDKLETARLHKSISDDLKAENARLKAELENEKDAHKNLRSLLQHAEDANSPTRPTFLDPAKSPTPLFDQRTLVLPSPPTFSPTSLVLPSPPTFSPTSYTPPPSTAESKTDNVRKTYISLKKRYDNLHSAAADISSATRGMDVTSFGEFGGYLKNLRAIVEDGKK